MKKLIPIAVEKTIPMIYKFVEWKIHNVCTYDCSFCGDRHKDGSQRWFSLDTYKEYTDKIIEACNGKPFWIQLTGGEPTLYPDFLELLKYIKNKGGMTSVITNGSRSLRWWEELKEANVLDLLQITYHSEQTKNYEHIVDIINLFHDQPVDIHCLITHVSDTIELAFQASEFIKANTGALVIVKAMIIRDYDIYETYTDAQLKKLKLLNGVFGDLRKSKKKSTIPIFLSYNHRIKISYDNGTTETSDPQTIMKNQENNFFGWSCNIGIDTMRVDHDLIYRGVCEAGGVIQSLSSNKISFADTPLTCDKTICFCGTDIIANKRMV
jgi:organic radical activating enzyme